MATNTPLQSILLTSSTSTVTFSNIDQTYTDLVLVASTRSLYNGTNDALFIQINGDSSALYSRTEMYNSSGGRASSETAFKYHGKTAGATSNAGTFGTSTINFMNYSNATTYKTLIARCGMADSTYSEVKMSTGLYRSTNAITSMAITSESGTSFVAGSTFDLYGIKSGTPRLLGGDSQFTDGNYWYHVFTTTGSVTALAQSVNVDYLVVAGGGGGSGKWYYTQGGGGAGGLRSTVTATGGGGSLESKLTLAAGSHTVTVGAGGAGATGPLGGTVAQHTGTQGSNSVFSTITSIGGGGGAGSDGTATSGGSGGGAGDVNGGAGTSGQGYAGGNSNGGGGWSVGGGGGGAGAVGGNGTNPTPGAGGVGVQLTAFATPTSTGANSGYYAGGGGGGSYDSLSVGAGGSGGGGAGSSTSTGVAGTANTGGGGGAGSKYFSTYYDGGNGGSGIVIVRYAV